MPIKIILRTGKEPNLFRNILTETACSSIGDKILICSGFFQETEQYRATEENGFIDNFARTKKQIMTIGIHNGMWKTKYKEFVNKFKKKGIHIEAYIYNKYHWHSKTYLLYENERPILGIIGSSNITRNAFGITSPFNVESDVVLWVENKQISKIINQQLSPTHNKNYRDEYYNLQYIQEQNYGISIQDRLDFLHKNIMHLSDRFVPVTQ